MDTPPTNGKKQSRKPAGSSLTEQRADQWRVLLMDSMKAAVSALILGFILFLFTYLYLIIKNNTIPSLESLATLFNGVAMLVNAVMGNGQGATP